MAHAQVHRFGGKVAVAFSGGRTQYMLPAEAEQLALRLHEAAHDVETRPFTKSQVGTFEMDFDGSPT